jgi:hypothetical protein
MSAQSRWRSGTVHRRAVACVALFATIEALAAGSSVTFPQDAFKRMIATVGRPEIVVCMQAAQQRAHADPNVDALRWGKDVSDTAHVEDSESGGDIVRAVTLLASGHEAKSADSGRWRPVRVTCLQREGSSTSVRFDWP